MKYQPIDCNFYDILEAIATQGTTAKIVLKDGEEEEVVHSKIMDLYTRNSEEFMVLEGNVVIRLDRIISVNNEYLEGFCKI